MSESQIFIRQSELPGPTALDLVARKAAIGGLRDSLEDNDIGVALADSKPCKQRPRRTPFRVCFADAESHQRQECASICAKHSQYGEPRVGVGFRQFGREDSDSPHCHALDKREVALV